MAVPTDPTSFAVSQQTTATVSLSWTLGTGQTSQVLTQWDGAHNGIQQTLTLGSLATAAAIGGLTAGAHYVFRIQAVNGEGNSGFVEVDGYTSNEDTTATAITANTTFFASEYLPDMPKATAPTIVWTVTDANGDPVNLSGKVVRIAAYGPGETLVFKHSTNDVGPAINISGTSHNTVTWNVSVADTANVRDVNYMLWNITDELVLAKGGFSVIDSVQS